MRNTTMIILEVQEIKSEIKSVLIFHRGTPRIPSVSQDREKGQTCQRVHRKGGWDGMGWDGMVGEGLREKEVSENRLEPSG